MAKLTQLQQDVLKIIKEADEILISDISEAVYYCVKPELRPKVPNNSVLRAIEGINRKMNNMIKGRNRGSKGKTVHVRKAHR